MKQTMRYFGLMSQNYSENKGSDKNASETRM